MITITVSGDTPQLIAAHVAWLSDKLGGTNVIADVIEHREAKVKRTADKAIAKAKEPAAPALPQAGESEAAETPAAGSDLRTVTVSAAPSITHDSARTLAAVKAKKVGPAVVKGVIADTGFAQIADIDKHEVLVSLYKNLEAL